MVSTFAGGISAIAPATVNEFETYDNLTTDGLAADGTGLSMVIKSLTTDAATYDSEDEGLYMGVANDGPILSPWVSAPAESPVTVNRGWTQYGVTVRGNNPFAGTMYDGMPIEESASGPNGVTAVARFDVPGGFTYLAD